MKRQGLRYRPGLKPLARKLRNNQTEAEQLLWSRLRRKQVLDVQFYRQRPIGDFIVDFFTPIVGLVIEVDGGQHWDEHLVKQDQRRDHKLKTQGLTILRFSNLDVMQETEAVMEKVFSLVESALENPPQPPFGKGGRS